MHRQLTYLQRQKLERLLLQNLSQTAIAIQLGIHRSTISRELKRNCPDGATYCAEVAQGETEDRRLEARHKRTIKVTLPQKVSPSPIRFPVTDRRNTRLRTYLPTLHTFSRSMMLMRRDRDYPLENLLKKWQQQKGWWKKSHSPLRTKKYLPTTVYKYWIDFKQWRISWRTPSRKRSHQKGWINMRMDCLGSETWGTSPMEYKRKHNTASPKPTAITTASSSALHQKVLTAKVYFISTSSYVINLMAEAYTMLRNYKVKQSY
ncbi:helix-turn-helix domain-containing protein [Limibacter armeniacum]|uniref:helix-turn-helix domain-containing protein n=1 Tax=Limibacter armeniacum TaxID=466084 RepID=UPI002FE63C05